MATKSKFSSRLQTLPVIILAAFTLGGLASCGGGDADTTAPQSIPQPITEPETSSGSKTLSWFAQISESIYDVAKGVAALAEGNLVAGFAEFSAAGFGLISKGLESGESGDDQAEQLTVIDGKLDTLIVDVQSLAIQLGTVEAAVDNLAAYTEYTAAMKKPMDDAQTWLDSYYTNQTKTLQSREWVRWYTAGCNTANVGSCPSTLNSVTAYRLAAFRQAYVRNPMKIPMEYATDNFPLWWAYSVIGDQTTGAGSYRTSGSKASDIVTQIYDGLTSDDTGTKKTSLISYMNYFMTQSSSHCSSDVTDPECDLFTKVYLPLEAYFSLAIARQSLLVTALAEADTVLGQTDPAYGSAGKDLMVDFNNKLNVEVEAFLQAAEQIALYRAADGRTDWTNFAATDAGRLLARADFVAMQLASKNYRTASTTPAWTEGYVNPPWPSTGLVGRVFYANGEPPLAGTATRMVRIAHDPVYYSKFPLGEDPASLRTVTGVQQPYLLWKRTVDAKTGDITLMTGTATTLWKVQRLIPIQDPPLAFGGNFEVDSTQSSKRLPAKLTFNNYDQNFVTPPGPDTRSVIPKDKDGNLIAPFWSTPFGSFSSVEGAIGRYGLALDDHSFKAGDHLTGDLSGAVYSWYNVSNFNDIPGAANFRMRYLPNPTFGVSYDGVGATKGTWTATTPVKLVIAPDIAMRNVKLIWPSTLKVDLNSDYRSDYRFIDQIGIQREYYSYADFKQEILSNGKTLENVFTQCSPRSYSYPFYSCQIDQDPTVDVTFSMGKAADMSLTFNANFATEVSQLDYFQADNGGRRYKLQRTSIYPSTVDWAIQAPLFTLTRELLAK